MKDLIIISESYIILPWLYYEVKARNEMHLFLGANQCFYKNKSDLFCNLTGKVLKIHSYYLSFLNLMLHFSTYIHLVVYTYKTRQNIFFFASKSDIWYPGIFWEIHVLLLLVLVYLGIVILRK